MDIFKMLSDVTDDYREDHNLDTIEEYRKPKRCLSDNETNVELDNQERARDMNNI